ncbi:cobalamin biosynthesis protein CobG [Streptomyces sp. NPDC059874]|uniref:cobalamin biosynthesis protein CobG n=1 Tax=Streptomyces sp. NPDC059874 TaxID=3346983 RepID=UPI003647F8C3
MLAAMPQPPSAASRDEPVIRDRGDACPGALRLHAADDGFLARVRIPGGLLDAPQAAALALAADRFGDGHLELTSRGNVQLRGLGEECGGGLAELLDGVGLLPAPAHERVRNIVATPLADAGPVRALDALLCADPRVTALSGRFLFAVDDGRGDVAALDPDITLLGPDAGGRTLLRLGAARDAVEVAEADAPRAALMASHRFLDAVADAGTRAWRIAELPPEHALDTAEFGEWIAASGIPAGYVPDAPRPYAPPPAPGVHADALCVLIPLGRLTTAQWRTMPGELRITPWRSIVVTGAPDVDPGLVTDPDSAWRSVTACTGRPGCAKSLADVRADARAVVADARGSLPVHWSGCERRCGHPRGTQWVDALATGDGYRLTVHGREVPCRTRDLAAGLTAARNAYPSESEAAVKK